MSNPVDLATPRPGDLEATPDRGSTIIVRITGVIREGSHEVTPINDCDGLHVGDRLIGRYVAPTGHRGRACLQVQPTPTSSTTREPPIADDPETSGTWELDTTHMRPRRYSVSLRILDGALVGSPRCYSSVAVEFCLQPRLSELTRRFAWSA